MKDYLASLAIVIICLLYFLMVFCKPIPEVVSSKRESDTDGQDVATNMMETVGADATSILFPVVPSFLMSSCEEFMPNPLDMRGYEDGDIKPLSMPFALDMDIDTELEITFIKVPGSWTPHDPKQLYVSSSETYIWENISKEVFYTYYVATDTTLVAVPHTIAPDSAYKSESYTFSENDLEGTENEVAVYHMLWMQTVNDISEALNKGEIDDKEAFSLLEEMRR